MSPWWLLLAYALGFATPIVLVLLMMWGGWFQYWPSGPSHTPE